MRMLRTPGAWGASLPAALMRYAPGTLLAAAAAGIAFPTGALASELDLKIPAIDTTYSLMGMTVSGHSLMLAGLVVCILGMLFGLMMFNQVKNMPAHQRMLDVSNIIYETCKTYLAQQGRLLAVLFLFIGACIV